MKVYKRNLLNAIARELKCDIKDVGNQLNSVKNRQYISNHFSSRHVRTTYRNKAGNYIEFLFNGITSKPASGIMAYNDLGLTFNVTVPQHFYTRHRIRLQFPHHPCIMEKESNEEFETIRYYPIELLNLIEDEQEIFFDQCISDEYNEDDGYSKVIIDEQIYEEIPFVPAPKQKNYIYDEVASAVRQWSDQEEEKINSTITTTTTTTNSELSNEEDGALWFLPRRGRDISSSSYSSADSSGGNNAASSSSLVVHPTQSDNGANGDGEKRKSGQIWLKCRDDWVKMDMMIEFDKFELI